MKSISFLIGLFILFNCKCFYAFSDTISNKAILIKGEDFKGTSFEEDYSLSDFYFYSTNRWTPNYEDIRLAERKLKNSIKLKMILSLRRKRDYYYINKHLKLYRRQYVGYIEDSVKYIYINCYIDYPFKDTNFPDNYLIFVLGGGANYFSCSFDCKGKRIISMSINAPE